MDVVQKTIGNKNNTKSIIKYSLVLLVFIGALFLSNQNDGPSKFPKVVTDEFTFTAWVNEGEDYLKKNYRWITKILANYIKAGYYFLEDFISVFLPLTYSPNQAAPAPTTTETKPACALLGFSRAMNHCIVL